jgi:hypothetical protein
MLVHGTAIVPDTPTTPGHEITIPNGTPLLVDVYFDTNTPNALCGSDPLSGLYFIDRGSNSNSATVRFLGYEYGASGGIEINTFASIACDGPGSGVRLFVDGPAVPLDPNGTQIRWSIGGPVPFGNMFLMVPPSAWLAPAYPSGLPPEFVPFGGHLIIGNDPALTIESTQLRLVPEPATAALVGVGVLIAAFRKRRRAGSSSRSARARGR